MSLEQAARNAIDAEMSSAGYYLLIAESVADGQVREFFTLMADQERQHAEHIRVLARRLGAGALPHSPNTAVRSVEAVMGWEGRSEMAFQEAVELALAAENNAELTYETWAEQLEGAAAELFLALAADEARHAMILQQVLDSSSTEELARSLTLSDR